MSEEIPEWAKEALPEQFHNIPFLKGAQDAEQFISRLTGAADHIGNSVRIPGPDAADDDWSKFDEKLSEKVPGLIRADLESSDGQADLLAKLGRPEEAAGYGADEANQWLADLAHGANLTKGQFEMFIANLAGKQKEQSDQAQAAINEAVEALHTEWGLAKAKKLENIEGLLKLTEADEGMQTALKEGKLDATTLKWLDGIAEKFSQGIQAQPGDRTTPEVLTPAEAHAQINELMNNPEYYKETPLGRELRKKMLKLQQAAAPGATTSIDAVRNDDLGEFLLQQ